MKGEESNIVIINKTRSKMPRVLFNDIAENILGKKHTLSIVLCGDRLSRRLNRTYRQKDRPTNILSFTLSTNEGEIYLCLPQIRRELKKFDRDFDNLVAYLLIHGLFHLKGMEHGSTMESKEATACRKFGI